MTEAAAGSATGLRSVRIGTRSSALARVQTEWVASRLRDLGVTVQIELIDTRGDARADIPIEKIGGDGVFVRELERALLEQRIDVAVHSMKDLPTAETPGLVIACVPRRATPFDAFVGRTAPSLETLPAGAVVGTSSIRRVVQVKSLRPDLVVRPVRGNVDTRLRKLDAGDFDGLILAGAGLERLGLGGRVTQMLAPPLFWPAVAQGALAIQSRSTDERTRAALAPLDDPATHRAGQAERACLAALAGGCLAPIAAWARTDESGAMRLDACVFEERDGGVSMLHAETVADGSTPPSVLGKSVAGQLLARGADAMLARMRHAIAANGLQPPPR
jgi:hydroxymethylbilane synthase